MIRNIKIRAAKVVAVTLLTQLCAGQVTAFGTAVPTLGGLTPTIGLPSSVYGNGGNWEAMLQGPPSEIGFIVYGGTQLPAPVNLNTISSGFAGNLYVSPDVVAGLTFSSGGGHIFALPSLPASAATFFLQLVTQDGAQLLGASSQGYQIDTQSPPVISSLTASFVNSGDPLGFGGTNIPQNPRDTCYRLVDPANGNLLAIFSPQTSTGTSVMGDSRVLVSGGVGRVEMMPGTGGYLDPALASPGISFGPTDVRAWTSSMTVGAISTQTVQTGTVDVACSFHKMCYVAATGRLEVRLPGTLTCPPNSTTRLVFDCEIAGDPRALTWDYSGTFTNASTIGAVACGTEVGVTCVTAFATERDVLVIFGVTSDSISGEVIVTLAPLIGSINAADGQLCGGIYIDCP